MAATVNVGTLEALLKLRDEMSPALSVAAKNLDRAGQQATKAGRALAPLSIAMAGIGVASIKFAKDFNASMANVATLIPGNTKRVQELKGEVQGLAVTVGKGTDDISEGLYQVVSAFGDTADSMTILETNAKAAAAGLATTTDAINLTSAVTKGYGDASAEAVEKASDLAFATVKMGQTTFPELASAIGKVVPIASALGVSQEELFTGFATLTGVTGSAAEVTTQLRGVMAGMLKPTEDMKGAMAALGIESAESMIAQHGLVGSMNMLIGTTDGSTEAIGGLFANVESLPAVFALNSGQADVFAEKLEAMGSAAGATDEAFKEQTEGINKAGFAWEQLKVQVTVIAQKFGDTILPVLVNVGESLEPMVDALMWAVDAFSALPSPVKAAAVALMAVVASAAPLLVIAGQVSIALGGLTAATGLATGAMGLLALKFAAAVAVFTLAYKGTTALMGAMSELAPGLSSVARTAVDATRDLLTLGLTNERLNAAFRENSDVIDKNTGLVKGAAKAAEEVAERYEKYKATLKDVSGAVVEVAEETKKLAPISEAAAKAAAAATIAKIVAQEEEMVSLLAFVDAFNEAEEAKRAKVQEVAQATADIQRDLQNQLALANAEGLALRLLEIKLAHEQELAVLAATGAAYNQTYIDLVAALRLRYEQEVTIATEAHTSIALAAEAAGFQTKAAMEDTAKKALELHKRMAKSGLFTAAQLSKAWDAYELARQETATATGEHQKLTWDAMAAAGSSILGSLFGKSKRAALAGIIIDTATAIIKCFAQWGWPWGIAPAAAAAAAGWAQYQKVKSQSFATGTPDLDFSQFGASTATQLHGEEAVIPRGGGHQLAGEIALALGSQGNQASSSMAGSIVAAQSGGGSGVTIHYAPQITVNGAGNDAEIIDVIGQALRDDSEGLARQVEVIVEDMR